MCGAVAIGLVVPSGLCSTALAGPGGTKLTVRATVPKRTSLKVLAQPGSVAVTAGDIARGYVDVLAPAQVAIKSNTSGGYLLEFASQGDFMRQILVTGLANDVQLSPSCPCKVPRALCCVSAPAQRCIDVGRDRMFLRCSREIHFAWTCIRTGQG